MLNIVKHPHGVDCDLTPWSLAHAIVWYIDTYDCLPSHVAYGVLDSGADRTFPKFVAAIYRDDWRDFEWAVGGSQAVIFSAGA